MTVAAFTLCAWWCASAVFGAAPPPSGRVVAHAGGGLAVVLPTVEAGVLVGVAGDATLALRWETHAGFAHSVAAGARVRIADGWALGVELAYADFISRRVFGVDLSRSPFGIGLTVEPGWAWTRRDGRLAVGGGLTVRVDEPGVQSARVAVTLDLGPLFLRGQALVPLAESTRVLGYFPAIVVGKTFGL